MTGSHTFAADERIRPDGSWLQVLRHYVAFIAGANLIWEFAQLPLYTIWFEGSVGEILFAVAHCTAGDALIAVSSLFAALVLAGDRKWPWSGYERVAALTLVFGLSYTIFSEWLNTEIRRSWAYTDLMPTLPLIGSGLSPLAQWIVIPLTGFWWARRSLGTRDGEAEGHPTPSTTPGGS